MQLQPSIAQLHYVEGVRQASLEIPGLAVRLKSARATRGRQDDMLFVNLALSGRLEQVSPLMDDLVHHIERTFYSTRGSVTTAMRQAIMDANSRLLQVNVGRREGNAYGALSCAVLRDGSLYLAQVGEGVALFGRNLGVERQPPDKPLSETPLGSTAGVDIRFFHKPITPESTLLLIDPRLNHLPNRQYEAALVDALKADAISHLDELLERDSGRLLWVRFDLANGSPAGDGAEETAGNTVYHPPSKALPKRDHTYREADGRGQRPERTQPLRPTEPTEPTLPTPAASTLPAEETVAAEPIELDVAARRTAARGLGIMAALTGGLANAVGTAEDDASSTSTNRFSSGLAIAAAILIPFIVAGLALGILLRRDEQSQLQLACTELAQAVLNAQTAENQGLDARPLYMVARQRADEATAIRANAPCLSDNPQTVQAAIDRIDGIERLSARRLATFDEGAVMTGIGLQFAAEPAIFTLDSASDRLFYHAAATNYANVVGEPELLLQKGDAVDDYIVGDLVDLAWRSAGTVSRVDGMGVLDQQGGFVTISPDTLARSALRLGLASEWRTPSAITLYQERLYVLDAPLARIWRYIPSGTGLISDAEYRAIEALGDLEQAVDVTILPEDGSVVVLYSNGDLRRYANNRLQWGTSDLTARGLPQPLVAPTNIYLVGSGLRSTLFVADPATERIVQLSLNGNYLATYKASSAESDDGFNELVAGLNDFAVLDIPSSPLRVFFVTNNALYVAEQQ